MIPRIYRLPATVSLQNARFVFSSHMSLKVKENDLEYNRFGFIISKRVCKTAVDRNRTKRIVRSCIEKRMIDLKKGNDILFIIKQNLAERKSTELEGSMEELLSKGGLLT